MARETFRPGFFCVPLDKRTLGNEVCSTETSREYEPSLEYVFGSHYSHVSVVYIALEDLCVCQH